MKRIITYCLLLILSATGGGLYAQVTISNLRCEMLQNPQGIDVTQPRLSWEINSEARNVQQTAYQIIVSSTKEKLQKEEGDIWNSGKITSSASIHITYSGKPLSSRQQCWWKVRNWTSKGESNWSAPAYWSMGLLGSNEWKAKWIGFEHAFPWDSITTFSRLSARYFRKPFTTANTIKSATVYIVGLGLYELYINGVKVGNQVLSPAPTDYRQSVLSNAFDVTAQLKKGNNVVAAVLGNGRFFTMRQNYKPQKISTFGYPKLLLQLEITYADGKKQTIISDESWKGTADGPIRTNNEYDGEEYDAAKEMPGWNNIGFNDTKWLKPELVTAPEGKIKAQMNEGIKVMQEIRPVSIKSLKPGVHILDMGQNMVGWLAMKVKGSKGQRVKLRFAETLEPSGELYVANLRDAKVTDVYTLKGIGEEWWEPKFVYHGFRYVEITNYPGNPAIGDFEGKVIYDSLQTTSTFETSNEIINKVHRNAWWGIAGNYKGMPLDCPQRNERMPWLGDRATGSRGESYMFGNGALYAKWLDDIEQSQKPEGAIPDVAPAYWNYYSDNMTWPGTYILVADLLYNHYGDKQPIIKYYASMKKWMDYMRSKYMVDYIVTKDKYGDWCVPPESKELIHAKDSSRITDGVLIATAYYYRMLYYMQGFAKLLNKKEDEAAFAKLAQQVKNAFNKKFFNTAKKEYSNNTVTANLLPLYFGMVEDSLRDEIFGHISWTIRAANHGHISTGLVGTQWLMRGLTEYDRADLAYDMATNRDYPGWGYMVDNGATTIWELWNGNTANPSMNSGNHVMLLGDLITWYYENLAGIKSDSIDVAFKKIVMKPAVVDGLDFVKASYHSVYGNIKSEWHKTPGIFTWNITVPANTSAVVYLPAGNEKEVREGNQPAASRDGIKFIGMQDKHAVYEVGSGSYSFTVAKPWKDGILKDEFIFNNASFPESHASTIVETPAGLVAAWFGGTREGFNDVCIWVSRLVNGSWTAPQKAAEGIINDTLRYACYNPVLYQVPGGELQLYYKVGPRVSGWKGWMMTSKDNGITWSKPQALLDGYLGPVKNKPVLLSNGELYCASSTEGDGWKVHFEVTPDFGKTWKKIGPINDGKTVNAIQPSILTYKDGRLQILCRTRNRAIYESWSSDNGKTWSAMTATSLPNNNSGTDAVTLKDGRQLLVYNHVLPPGDETKGPRTPLNVAISEDGKTWYAVLVLEDSPISQYSYPSVIQSADGMVHIVYTWRRERIKYVTIDPSKLKPVKIENGVWPVK